MNLHDITPAHSFDDEILMNYMQEQYPNCTFYWRNDELWYNNQFNPRPQQLRQEPLYRASAAVWARTRTHT